MATSDSGSTASGPSVHTAAPTAGPVQQTTHFSNASSITAPSGDQHHEWACSCLNVRIHVIDHQRPSRFASPNHATSTPSTGIQAVHPATLASADAIQVAFPYLTTRENVSLPDGGLTLACTRCLNCHTLVYGAARPAPPGPARTYGFLPATTSTNSAANAATTAAPPPESPSRQPSSQAVPTATSTSATATTGAGSSARTSSREARPYEPFVRPLDGHILLLPDALTPQQAKEAQQSDLYSPAFRILVQRDETTAAANSSSSASKQAQAASEQAESSTTWEMTPGRPSISAARRSSVGPLPSAAMSYTLPAVPVHLITSPPQSPRVGGGGAAGLRGVGASSSGAKAAAAPFASASANTSSSLLSCSLLGHPLASMLDATAVERLRDFRAKAEAEVFELVRQKRREMEALEKRTREEAETLLEATRMRKPQPSLASSGGASGSLVSAALGLGNLNSIERGWGRGSSVAAPEGARSRDLAAASSESSPASTQQSHGYPGIGDHDHDHDHHDLDLSPTAFERRSTLAPPTASASGARTTTMSTSLSALSASFAMRGRDAPSQLEDWASKRRLRERYPEGDHSAMTSAVNSTANSTADSNNNSDDDEGRGGGDSFGLLRSDRRERVRVTSKDSLNTEDEAELADRGRGRGRGASASHHHEADRSHSAQQPAAPQISEPAPVAATATGPSAAAELTSRGRQGRTGGGGPSQLALPGMTSSFKSKAASVLVDDGTSTDADTPQVGGRLISPQSAPEPSDEVTLRPRNPPPSNTEPLKPATRAGNGSGVSADAGAVAAAAAAASGSPAAGTSSLDASVSTVAAAAAGDKKIKPRRSAEKKVAFAEAEDTVDHDVPSEGEDSGDDDDDGNDVAGSRELVDETDAAVFEIDEESQGNEEADWTIEANDDDDGLNPSEPQDVSPTGVRRGASGRVRGHGDDSVLGDEEDEDNNDDDNDDEGDQSATDLDDGGSHASLDQGPGFGAASFSAMAARESAMSHLATSLARADDSGFDPASLRLDGRVVPESAADFNDGTTDGFVVGSAADRGYRGYSGSFRPSSISRGWRTSIADVNNAEAGGDHAQPPSCSPSTGTAGGVAKPRSGSRTRVGGSKKSGKKDDADTESRLSVAPNAPSHRSLWSPKVAKSQKGGKHKYQLDEENDQKWAAWQRKIRETDSSQPSDDDATMLGRSVPMNVAPPAQFLATGHAVGGGPMRGPALGSSRATAITSPSDGARSSFGSGSGGASTSAISISISRRGQGHGYGSFYDSKSGFDCEPKTSLPYNEKMLVPSLRKAIRRSAYEQMSKLETIEDNADAEVSPNTAAGPSSSSMVKPTPIKAGVGAGPAEKKPSTDASLLPDSVVTKDFALPPPPSVKKADDKPAASFTYKPLSASQAIAAAARQPERTVSDSLVATMKEAGVGTTAASGTGTSTPASIASRRSPRPPYERPPPPTSYSIVLDSDPAMAPRALELFEVAADRTFSLYEASEEVETEEGWVKTLEFLHTIEKLKRNPRTGWLHHRVAKPESIADHMYRMGVMALLLPKEEGVDVGKCCMLALVHDLAEAEVGDLTPLDGVSKDEKMRREHDAILYFAHDLLGSSAAGLRIEELWNEYEDRQTNESKLVKDLDRFELCLQAVEYEKREGINDLQPFFEGSIGQIRHPRVRRWAVELAHERRRMWAERGIVFEQTVRDE